MGLERLLGMYLVKSIPVTNIAFQTLKGLPLNVRGVSRLNIRILPNCGSILNKFAPVQFLRSISCVGEF